MHQFCRIGRHAFIGGFSVITKDALPFAKTVGNRPARNYGLNTIGLVRRRIPADAIAKLKQAYRYLLTSKLNTTRALAEIERDQALACPEVRSPRRLHPHLLARRGAAADADATGRRRRRRGRVASCRRSRSG